MGLVPVLVQAVQEQQQLISTQEARIAALEKRGDAIVSPMLGNLGGGIALGLMPLIGLAVAGLRRNGRGFRS